MLQRIRDRLTGKIALAILALIAASFVLFGVDLNFGGFGFAAQVDGEEISANEFENAYRSQMISLAEQGTEVPEQLRSLVREGVLDRLIQERLIEMYLDEAGFEVSDRMVTDAIQTDPAWQVDGRFSRDSYYETLERQRIDPAQYEARQRAGMEEFQLRRGIAATAFVTPAEYRRYLNLYAEQRTVDLAEIDLTALTESIEVTDEEVTAYYEQRADDFMAPESVDLAYVELRRDEIAEGIEISEDELADYYEVSKDRFRQDEQRRARHILILFGDDEAAAEEQARALTARVEAGEPFDELAAQYSADSVTASRGGDLGLLPRSQYFPEGLGDAVFTMTEGDVQGPVRTDFGFHVVRLEDITAGGALPFAEVRNELLLELQLEKSDARYLTVERDLSDALFDADTIQELADASGLELKTAEGYTRSGGDPFGSNQAAIDTVFDPRVVEDREMSDIVELDANRSVVVTVTDYQEAARRPLEEVRDQIVADIRNERAFNIANERVATVRAALDGGAPMSDAVADLADVTTRTATVTRQSTDIDQQVRAAVFQAKKPAANAARTGTALTADNRYVVFHLTAVEPGRPESIPLADRDAGKEQLAFQAGNRDYAALIAQLVEQADIVKSDDALERETLFE